MCAVTSVVPGVCVIGHWTLRPSGLRLRKAVRADCSVLWAFHGLHNLTQKLRAAARARPLILPNSTSSRRRAAGPDPALAVPLHQRRAARAARNMNISPRPTSPDSCGGSLRVAEVLATPCAPRRARTLARIARHMPRLAPLRASCLLPPCILLPSHDHHSPVRTRSRSSLSLSRIPLALTLSLNRRGPWRG